MKKKIEEKNNVIESMKKQLENIKNTYSNSSNEIKNAMNEKENKIKELQKDNQSLISKIEQFQRDNDKLEEEINEKKKEIIEKNNDITKYKEEMKTLQKDLEFLKNNNKKLKSLQNKEDELKKLQSDNQGLIDNIVSYKNKIDDLENENRQLQSEVNKKIDEVIQNKEEELSQIKNQLEEEYKQKINTLLEEINELKKQNLSPNIITKPPLVGLNNIGSNCFMNSIIQCLSQIKELSDYFLDIKNRDKIINNNLKKSNPNSVQLCPLYLELIQNLWKNDGTKTFSPDTFVTNVSIMNKDFKLKQAGDSKDFVIFILQQLHKELKSKIDAPKGVQKNTGTANQYDEQSTLADFMNKFTEDYSIIADYFFGIYETKGTCINCQNLGYNNSIVYNFQIYHSFIFPLQEVRNAKCMAMNNNMIDTVSIYDCFIHYQRRELLTGENQLYCNICKQISDSFHETKIYSTPKILVLILNRGKDNMYKVNVNFDEVIDLTQYCIGKDKPQLVYYLCGVVTHLGQSGQSAHFVASCKNCIDNKWYKFNDAFIKPITDLRSEVFQYGTPYILFYRKFD